MMRPKKAGKICKMERENELAIGDIQDISVEDPEHRDFGVLSTVELR